MSACDQIRSLLDGVIDGESKPRDSFLAARHLSSCTACRILLARKRRLTQMLEEELHDIPVGEDFLHSVMDALPSTLPVRRARRRRHGLKLAVLAMFALPGLEGLLRGLAAGAPTAPRLALPAFDSFAGSPSLEGATELLRWAVLAAQSLSQLLPAVGSGPFPAAEVLLVIAVALGGAALCVSTLVAIAAGSLLRVRA